MVETILEVSHLSVCRGGHTVVDDVSFALCAESDTALVGPNGAGKSSLVQAMVGILPHHAGSVRLLGHALGPRGQLPAALRNQVAYLPQTLSLQGRLPLTVAEFVGLGWDPPGPALPWQAGGARGQAVREALAKVDAAALAPRLFSNLSAGQQKRVLLAFCVVRPRRLLILDEAQAGLDPRAGERFHSLLYQLRRSEGWTILQVSHDLDMVRRTCDTVLCLNRSLRCSGSPEHALSPQQLERLYGRGFVPYLHHHHTTDALSPAP
ncbi:MAG: metal ABC transporter ATP-binding protein [Synechococcaceae cyanobacterium]|nr:metal ABC transporter ATP-binding protein [Synechococcaceae cyanobacterium]